jgi:hypothetical protein
LVTLPAAELPTEGKDPPASFRAEIAEKHFRCACCRGSIEPAQELRFLVETASLDDPAYLADIRRLPANRAGQPVPVCAACQRRVESAPRSPRARRDTTRPGVLAVVGILSVGWLIQNLLLGPRG